MRLSDRLTKSRVFPFILFAIGTGCMLIGIFVTKEPYTVLSKAIRICLECIGIG